MTSTDTLHAATVYMPIHREKVVVMERAASIVHFGSCKNSLIIIIVLLLL